jgi:outer membrane protein assembly factor BamB
MKVLGVTVKKRYWFIMLCFIAVAICGAGAIWLHSWLAGMFIAPQPGNQPAFPLQSAWSTRLNNEILSLAASEDGSVLLARTTDSLFALRSIDGKLLWNSSLGSQVTSFPPVVRDQRVFATDRQTLWAFNLQTGKVAWRQSLPNPDTYVTDASASVVLVNAASDSVTAYDAQSGNLLWRRTAGRGYTPAFVSDEIVYAIDRGIEAFDAATGVSQWQVEYPATGAAVHTDGTIYFLSYGIGKELEVIAFDVASRKELWNTKQTQGGNEALALDHGMLFVMDNTSILGLSRDAGQAVWKVTLNAPRHASSLDGKLYVMEDFDGLIQALEMATGALSGSLKVSDQHYYYVPHVNLISTDQFLVNAEGNMVSAYSAK